MLGSRTLARLHTWLHGQLVGEDENGNRFYESRLRKDTFGRLKRWVVYKGILESTKVPPHWHGWLHYTWELPLKKPAFSWQKASQPNPTGTVYAYQPPLYRKVVLGAMERPKDYEPWKPS